MMNKILIYFLVILSITTICAYAAPVSEDTISNMDFDNIKISSLILAEMSRSGNDNKKIPVIISLTDDTTPDVQVLKTQPRAVAIDSLRTYSKLNQQNLATFLNEEINAGNARNMKQLWAANAIAIEISPNSISKIAQRPDVVRIEPDLQVRITDPNIESQPFSSSSFDRILNNPPMRSTPKDKIKGMPTDIDRDYPYEFGTAWGVEWIEAPELWSRGVTGTGINVSIIDTGINAQHPDLQGTVVAWKDFTKNIPFNGTSAWHSGMGDNLNNTLTRSFDLTGVTSATLEFDGRYEMEYGYDYSSDEYIYCDIGYVNISTDGGVSWDTLAVYKGISGYFDDGYIHETLDLTPYVDNADVLIRFAYVTDETYYWDGWYVDDIKIQEINFLDGAESGTTGWTAIGWDIKDNTVHWPSGNTWYSGAGDYLYNTLEQTFDFSGLASATLNFATKYDIESGYDNGYVQVLTGSNWISLATYTGDSDWTDKSIDLSSYVGSNVTIRFLYETDYIISYEGWYIDDIEIPEIGFYDDVESGANGWTADGWYVFTADTPYDDHGHGTHVAGTVAGTGADGLRTGVAPGANLMAAKVIDNYGYGSMSDVIRAVEWSVENNADVVSISLGMNPIDQIGNFGLLNESETAVENIYVFSNWFEGKPSTTISPTAYQPTFILGGVALFEEIHVWEALGYGPDTLTQTFNLTGVTSATLEFKTAFREWYDGDIGEVQASTDGVTWDTLAEYSGYSEWTNDSLSLDDYAGDNVVLRFVFEPYNYGFWQIDSIEISEIGFYDDVEAGNTGWTESGWYINDIVFPVDITNADISFRAPDGTQVLGDEAEWWYEGMIPDNIWFYKYTGTTLLQNGEWGLIIDSNFDSTITYETILLVGYPSDGTDGLSQSLNTAAALGVVPVVAAGNDGIFGLHSIGSPGASENAITVGATEYGMDYIAAFSSRGPVGFGTDEIIKPDVVAPGTYITSTHYLGGYAGWSGTSMATPHVSGAAALLLEADPTLTPTQVKQILMDTAIDLGETGMDNNYGAGRISAYAAVNATVDLPDPIEIRPDKYELFAGATLNDINLPPFIEDQAGDAVGYADIVHVVPYSHGLETNLHFFINTAGDADLSLSEFRLYLDTDRDKSTGNNVIITELGIDYYIIINGTNGYLYRWDAEGWQWVQNLYRNSINDITHLVIPFDVIGETISSVEINAVVDSFVPGGTLLDRAPDTGYGTFPWMDVTIDMVGISWNDSSGLPEQGMNVTFEVKKCIIYPYDYVTVAKITNTTDSSGMAKASVQFDQNEIDERYYVYISDETGNEILDDVYAYADDSWQYGYEPFIVPSYKNYYAEMNSTLSVKITMVTPEWEPYNENVTLVFGDEWDDDFGNVSVELTPMDGTIEYDLNLSTTDIDESYYNYGWGYGYIPVRILNGTLNGYDYEEYVGDIDIFEGQRYRTILSPDLTVASPGSTVDYLVEAVVSNMTVDRPISDNLTVEVVWISEVAVKNLNLKTSIINKLDLMRIQMEETGRSENLLTTKEQEKLLEVFRDAQIKNIGYNYTTFDINSNANGLAQFDINVPDDAYYGYVWVFCDADYGWYWYGDESVIIVIDNYKDLFHHPTAPESGTGFYDLDLDADWDYAVVDGSFIPDENITVTVDLELYDPQLDDWIGVPNEDVYLYATTGDVKMVTTDIHGEAEINFTAPSIDVLNSTWDEMSVQVWGITRLLTPNNEIAVAKDDWAYLDFTLLSNYSIPYVEINNNTLDITLEFKDSTWIDTTNVPTVLNMQKSFEWYSTKDLMSDYINSPTSTWQTSISLAEYGTYSVITSTEYPNLWGWNDYTTWWSHATFTPLDISSDIQDEYPRNINQPITVTVHDLQNNPVSGASVYIIEQENWYYYEDFDIPPTWNYIDMATTDSTGTATLTLKTPDRDTYVNYRIGGATSEFMFPYVESGYFSVEAPSNQPDLIVSSITLPDVINKGLPVDITVTVENIDIYTAGETTFSVQVNETVIGSVNMPPLMWGDRFTDSVSWTPDTAGIYTIQANVDPTNIVVESNEANNSLLIHVEVIEHVVDNTPPIAIITQPVEGAYLKGTIDIMGTANDTNFKNYTIEWKNTTVDWTEIHNSTVPVSDGTLATWNTDNLEDGDYSISLTVVDNASNSNITLINVTIDKTQPEVNITEPENDSNLKFFENIVRGEVNDDNPYSAQLIVKNETGETVNSYNLDITDGEFSNRVEFAPNQINTLELIAVDKAENSNSTNITVFVGNNTLIKQTNVTKGVPVTIDAQNETNTTIEFVSNVTTSDVTFTVTAITNETQINNLNNSVFAVYGEMAVGKIIEINVTGLDVTNESEVQSVTLYLYYTMADLDLDGDGTIEPRELDEDKLYIYWNDTSHNWTKLLKDSPDWVIDDGQVKISGDNPGYVWVKVNHLSMFALAALPVAEPTEDGKDEDGNGGGGGGGSSGEDFYNIVISETDRQSVFKNTSVSFIFDLEGNIVKHINFTALNSAGTIAAKVEILNNTSKLVSTPPPHEVFKNLNIWVGNAGWATERNIADATVVFTVDKSWITENNIDESSIALYRYSDDTWHKLVTRKIAEDANSLQFEAGTTGFSPFAVTGKKTMGEPGGEGIIEPTVTAEKTPIPTPTEKKGMPGFSLFAGVSVLLIAVQLLRKKN